MKQLFFILDFYPPHRGGIENVFENTISRLLKKGYHITLLTSRFDSKLKKFEQQDNLTIHRIGKGRSSFFWKAFRAGAKILRDNPNIEIIHTSTYTSAIVGSVLGYFFKKKRVLTVHEIFGALRRSFKPRYTSRIWKLCEWLIFCFPQEVYACVSLYTLNSLRTRYGIKDQKLQLLYNGVDTEFWSKEQVKENTIKERKQKYQREGKYLMLYYGHSGITKGIDYLVQAIPDLLQANSDAILIFNLIHAKRDHLLRKTIKQQAKKSGSPDRVVIFDGGEVDKLRELVACVDLVIAPSLAEGFGSVHSEACAMEKILITTQLAAIPEVVSGKVIFIQPRSASAIVQGVERARTGSIEAIAQKDFSREKNIQQLEQLYSDPS